MAQPSLTATQITGALSSKYGPPEWQTVCELADSTSGCNRRIDLFAVNCYGSQGWRTVACEVKVSRSDWLAETRDPGKREAFYHLASEFWYVSPPGVILAEEVPDGCGLYHVTDGLTFRTKRAAAYREILELPLQFVAALLRRCQSGHAYIPRATWKHEGKDLTPEDLSAIIEATYKRDLNDARRDGHRDAEESEMDRPFSVLGRRLADQMGKPYGVCPTREEFREWLMERGLVDRSSYRYELMRCRDTLTKLLGEDKPDGSTREE